MGKFNRPALLGSANFGVRQNDLALAITKLGSDWKSNRRSRSEFFNSKKEKYRHELAARSMAFNQKDRPAQGRRALR
ncbi:hypothetical protein [Luteolibacter luteus]|uniref:Uncharacterized protein n=1 Tax=Luteolibacter luteus TaxID=2728835 RepID=A0A858RRV9_9BACT|nr:hypothetical protein [Luteolibacter luteus]QJE98860.1 hypothetical protein HHL09_24790 [Luteolibacter luteus]